MSVPSGTTDHDDERRERFADVQAAYAATLVDEWVGAGIAHAVVCPGSRSTPLAVALARHPGITVHIRLDERSAAFVALGLGMSTGGPAVLLTTSGTAAVELHPAMVEADLAGTPLLACTADRPPELHQVGAPQTIDQARLYGSSTRWFFEPGVADEATSQTWRSMASRSVAEARWGPAGPGPVHLNLAFREPLLPSSTPAPPAGPGRPGGDPWHQAGVGPLPAPGSVVAELAAAGRRGVIVVGAGGGDPEAVRGLGRALGWPVLADPRSGVRTDTAEVVGAADGILRSGQFTRRFVPEVVLRLGAPWVSRVVNEWLADLSRAGSPQFVVDPWWRWLDPDRSATTVVRADPTALCRALIERAARSDPDPTWSGAWRAADAAAQSALTAVLEPDPRHGGDGGALTQSALSESALARRLFRALPSEATMVVSSSMPVRDVEAFAPPRPSPPLVLANRGANGIDGVVSTSLGVALGGGRPTVALVGDLAFLHDCSALVRSPGAEPPCTIVVADNGGGGIFSFLPPASALDAPTFEQLFGTPQATDVAAVAGGFGLPVTDVDDVDAAVSAVGRTLGSGGLSVVRVRLPGRDENVEGHRRVNQSVVAAVDAAISVLT
ncbi:MAG TPA: 2-succinyl-5-enolpyruvyl-6-hydroxy-3-cyclohexene-1-carboxylic-acid synthase [Acidimicrobiales bacterium]